MNIAQDMSQLVSLLNDPNAAAKRLREIQDATKALDAENVRLVNEREEISRLRAAYQAEVDKVKADLKEAERIRQKAVAVVAEQDARAAALDTKATRLEAKEVDLKRRESESDHRAQTLKEEAATADRTAKEAAATLARLADREKRLRAVLDN